MIKYNGITEDEQKGLLKSSMVGVKLMEKEGILFIALPILSNSDKTGLLKEFELRMDALERNSHFLSDKIEEK